MNSVFSVCLVRAWVALSLALCATAVCEGQTEMPMPTAEHELLKQFAGEWSMKATAVAAPGEVPMTSEGSESAKMLGGFWLVCRGEGSMHSTPVSSLLTVGYDPETKKYIGTFVCSVDSTLWKYTGSREAKGNKLVLETEGPIPHDPSKKAKFREILELVGPDHKVFTSYIQGEDGKLVEFAKIDYRRKK
jgi:hypothetical protein